MTRKAVVAALLLLAVVAVLPACETTRDGRNDPDPVSFDPPPPPRHEVQGPRPSHQHVWIPGHWKWERKQYMWEPGYWKVPPRGKTTWVPGYWEQRRRGWLWVDGRWQ